VALRLRQRSEASGRGRRIRKLRLLALLLVLFLLAGAAFSFGLVTAIASEIPQLDPATRKPQVDSVIYASNGKSVLAVLRGNESRVLVTTNEIAPIMRQAIVAVEDRRFYEHSGVDLRGIARALWQDIRSQAVVEGGSTITQQFVKNAYIRNEQSLGRKVREAALAWQLEQRWSKDRILTAYLNTIYFGNGAYGIQQAARAYFGKGAKSLTLTEAALLAGIPADPSRYDPVQHPSAAKARRRFVIEKLLEQGKIDTAQAWRARSAALPKPEDVRLPGTRGPAPYFVNYVTDQLVARFGAERVFGGGLAVTTTIDLGLQQQARKAITGVLKNPDGPTAALVAIDPRSGAVRAMFGGTNFHKSQFNLATQAERQPGSSFKPIVLATAFRRGISPVTTFESKPVSIDAGDRVWKVTNYEDEYLGRISLSQAMVHSDNSVYAQLTKLVGPKAIVDTAHRLGIGSDLPSYFSLGLGAVAVNPLDMARAYATIANDGVRIDGSLTGDKPRVVDVVGSRESDRTRVNAPEPTPVLPPARAELLTSILRDVVSSGTGRRAALPDRPAAGKTGTTDQYGDAWFVGYTPELVTAVWVGYPNELRPMLTEFHGDPVAGGTLPAEIWKRFMTGALDVEGDSTLFTPPPYLGSRSLRIVNRGGWKLDNGYCPGTRVVAFFSESAPEQQAQCYANEVRVPSVRKIAVGEARARLDATPLVAEVIGVPAPAGRRPGVVLRQEPRAGAFRSSRSTVRLWVTRPDPRYGLLPNLVGSSLDEARALLRRIDVEPRVKYAPGDPGTVVRQAPEAGVAAGPKLKVTLVVGRATPSETLVRGTATASRPRG
jgi:penicillin-binding protein 1A